MTNNLLSVFPKFSCATLLLIILSLDSCSHASALSIGTLDAGWRSLLTDPPPGRESSACQVATGDAMPTRIPPTTSGELSGMEHIRRLYGGYSQEFHPLTASAVHMQPSGRMAPGASRSRPVSAGKMPARTCLPPSPATSTRCYNAAAARAAHTGQSLLGLCNLTSDL